MSSVREYRFMRAEEWSPNLLLGELMDAAENRVEPGFKPYLVTQDGDRITGDLLRGEVLTKFKRAISNREVGPVFRIRDTRDVQFAARAVQAFSDADTTNGNAKADTLWNWIQTEFGAWAPRYAGAYVCKLYSQHRFGNALDVFFDTLAHQDIVASRVIALREYLHPYHVISQRRIWDPVRGWHEYDGDFHGHLHVDFDPNFPTSWPCGVRA